MSDLELNGDVPVLYWCQDDADRDEGRGYNVHLASGFIAERFDNLDDAVRVFKELLDNVGVRESGMFIVTNAPDAYDYGHAKQVGTVTTDRFQTLRVVRISTSDTPYHTNYQADRYRSGLYVVFIGASRDEAEQAAKAF